MTVEKAIKEITNILDTWLADNGFDLTTRFEADFGYYHNENVVAFGLLTTERNDELFDNFISDLGGWYGYNFINSFLHEVGHHMTYDEITDEEYEYGAAVKAFLSKKEKLNDYDLYTYFNLPIERKATQWAADYEDNNAPSVLELNTKVRKIVDNIVIR